MKSVFIAVNRKFHDEIETLVQKLKKNKVRVATAGKWNKKQKDTFESERTALLSAFRKIDKSDIVYIYSKNGYIGKTVAMEIAYAYARKKEIISFDVIEDFSARALISNVMSAEKLIQHCKRKE